VKQAGPGVAGYRKDASSVRTPFHKICTPMHTSRKAESLMTTFIPVGPMTIASLSAKP
jgi:hypothetical protein